MEKTAPPRAHPPFSHRTNDGDTALRLLMEGHAEAYLVVDAHKRVRQANDAAAALLGRAADELPGTALDLPVQAGRAAKAELHPANWPGPGLLAETLAVPIVWEGESALLVRLRLLDAPRPNLAEAQEQGRFRALVENSTQALALLATDGRVIYSSPAAFAILGHDPNDPAGRNVFDFMHPEDREAARGLFQQAMQEPGETVTGRLRFQHQDGSWRWVEASLSNLLAEPAAQGLVLNYRDVSEGRRSEAERVKAVHLLGERLKELMLLHHAARLFQADGAPVREVLQEVANSLAVAWQYPEIAAGRVTFGSWSAATANYAESPWRQRADFTAANGRNGSVEVVYLDERPPAAEGPFTDEERSTLNALADLLRAYFDRRAAADTLLEREAVIRAALSSLTAHIAVLNLAGDILIVNQAWERFARENGGAARQTGVGCNYLAAGRAAAQAGDLVARQALDGIRAVLSGALPLYQLEYAGNGPQEKRWFVMSVLPLAAAGGGVVVAHEDVTDLRRSEEEAQQRAQEFEALYRTSRELASEHAPAALLQKITERAIRLLNGEAGTIYLYDESAEELVLEVVIALPAAPGLRLPLGEGLAGRAAQQREPLLVDDYSTWSGKPRQFENLGLHSVVQVPMLYAGELVGVLGVGATSTSRRFTASDVRLLSLLAGQAGGAVHEARRLEEKRQRLAELEAVNKISAALRAAQTLDEMLPILLEETLAALGTEVGTIRLYDSSSGELRVAVARGWLTAVTQPMTAQQGISGLVFRTGHVYSARSLGQDEHWVHSGHKTEAAGWSGVCVPIRTAQAMVGALLAAARLPRQLTAQEVSLLTTVAEMAGNALHRMRLYHQTEQRLLRLAALRAMDVAINASLDVRVTLDILLDQATTALGADAAAVMTINPVTQTLEYAAGQGFRSSALKQVRLRLGQGAPGRAAMERRTLQLTGEDMNSELPERAALLKAEGFVAHHLTPLIAKGEAKGVLEVFRRSPGEADAEWIEFFEALAGQAAIAIDSARVFDSLQRNNLELAVAYDGTIDGWARALDLRDQETEGHSQRVAALTVRLAEALGIAEAEHIHLRRGALLHDIGHMGIPEAILQKPGPLTDDEWAVVRRHPQIAFDMLSPIANLRPALDIPLAHHERWDGTGYPRQLAGAEIPLAARLFAVVDVWEALHSARPYRPAWPEDKVRDYLRSQMGRHFEPHLVELFLSIQVPERG